MSDAFYNEIDPYAGRWLRNLMFKGHIAKGTVDERSITELTAADVAGPGQAHFFAGIGVWSHALRLAGWPDEFNVWSGSCPCQPFSDAGDGDGFGDDRHLWPAWFPLIEQRRPLVIVGEQVASAAGLAWFDAVSADLEGAGYAVAAFDLPAAGVGAPHRRQRLYFGAARLDAADEIRSGLADSTAARREGGAGGGSDRSGVGADCEDGRGVAHAHSLEPRRNTRAADRAETEDGREGDVGGRGGLQPLAAGAAGRAPDTERLGDTDNARLEGQPRSGFRVGEPRRDDEAAHGLGPAAGFWSNPSWVDCRDGKRRPVEPGTFPLVDGATARVGQLRAYGNAIVGPLAAAFLRCLRDTLREAGR